MKKTKEVPSWIDILKELCRKAKEEENAEKQKDCDDLNLD